MIVFFYFRSLQLLSSGLNLAMKQITDGNLKPSENVKSGMISKCWPQQNPLSTVKSKLILIFSHAVITMMNSKYKMILLESKKLNGTGLLQKANANNITADKILYEYAIQMVTKTFHKKYNQNSHHAILSKIFNFAISVSVSRS